jgi:hypothetical protein
MNAVITYFTDLTESFGAAWNRFWYRPSDPLPCAVLRLVVGSLVVLYFLSLSIDFDRWYAADGLVAPGSVRAIVLEDPNAAYYHLSYFDGLVGPAAWAMHVAAIGLAIAFTAGLLTRVSGLLTLVALLSYVHRLPIIASHIEPVLSFLLAYLVLGPADARLSVDAWLRRRGLLKSVIASDAPSMWATVSIRLIQVHLAAFYAMMGLTKLYGDGWWDGVAIWYLLAQTHSRPIDLSGLRRFPYLINFWTLGIVYYELAFPIFIWNRLARPMMLALGVLIWLALILATGHLLFGLTMLAAGLAFVPAEFYRGGRGESVSR